MNSEVEDLSETLAWTVGMIMQSDPEDRRRIAAAYAEAQALVAGIEKENGDARPRIVECFKRSDVYRAADDIACVGWILTALEERINEGDLPEWRKLRKVVRHSVKALPIIAPTFH